MLHGIKLIVVQNLVNAKLLNGYLIPKLKTKYISNIIYMEYVHYDLRIYGSCQPIFFVGKNMKLQIKVVFPSVNKFCKTAHSKIIGTLSNSSVNVVGDSCIDSSGF